VHARSRRVSRLAGIEHEYRTPRASQHQSRAEPCCAAAHDHNFIFIEYLFAHAHEHGTTPISLAIFLAILASRGDHGGMDDDLNQALTAVGPRLRALRKERDITLAELSTATGISESTLSRLESGGRKPTLELLLPLARAHGIPLDELVGAPDTGDPRIHLRPIKRHGRTFIPLTRRAGGIQAFKQIVPPVKGTQIPEPQSHEGYEWLYVLSGRVRLILGEQDLELKPGEAVEFDTHVPHWIGTSGPEPVEMLCLFGTQGERAHIRASS
jgi:transcriptional regulator with XRE-family HTH domain